jgi:phenylacetate-CoA ligase
MSSEFENLALSAFQRAARRVPAYQTLLKESGVRVEEIRSLADFSRLPTLEKSNTFQRFRIEELCVDGETGPLGSVLTSSGHSGIFAFGLNPAGAEPLMAQWTDELLDRVFGVRSRRTLLVNCLPMGVKILTQACTLAETSVRADMAAGLVKAFHAHIAQIILVGEAAFLKHLLELGEEMGVNWRARPVHMITGEEMLAENARIYFEKILGHDLRRPENGLVASSMGVAELGLNLFAEAPPVAPLIALRRALHQNAELRRQILGPGDFTPSFFTYDPRRILVEFDASNRLLVTTLDPNLRLPLIRYAAGDRGRALSLSAELRSLLPTLGIPAEIFAQTPIVALSGRGGYALAGTTPVYPEAVKEGIYADAALARLITANFRLISGSPLRIRIQLAPGIVPRSELDARFHDAIARYVSGSFVAACESYETFGSGMVLDYERKFQYLGPAGSQSPNP